MAKRKANLTYERCTKCKFWKKCWEEKKALPDLFICKNYKEND